MKLFKKLRERMADKGYTAELLSEYLGEGRQYISCRLRGITPWGLGDMYKTMRLLDIPFHEMYLYFPEDGKPVKEVTPENKAERILKAIITALEKETA